MATPGIISESARKYIIEHCSLTAPEMKKIISEKFGVDVSEVAIWEHLKVARDRAEQATRTADAHLSATIAERVNAFAPTILARYEKELKRIETILDGTNTEFVIDIATDGTRDKYWHDKYSKLYDQIGKSYLSLRPPIQTIRVESALDPDVVAIDSWDDDQIAAFENFKKTLAKKEN